jgi:hypothetical protein
MALLYTFVVPVAGVESWAEKKDWQWADGGQPKNRVVLT